MNINLALCCDDKFVVPVLVCLTSVFENNRNQRFDVYILTAGITKDNERKFSQLASTYNQTIEIKYVDTSRFSCLPSRGRYVVATYYRFILPEVIPDSKVLYLDGDIIVTNDIGNLWETELDNYACAVVEDQRCDNVKIFNRFKVF